MNNEYRVSSDMDRGYDYRPSRDYSLEKDKKPIRLYRGDMVKVIDEGCKLAGKFGLVEKVFPRGRDWQVVVKIGQYSNRMSFDQVRFCTRLAREDDFTSRRRDNDDRRLNTSDGIRIGEKIYNGGINEKPEEIVEDESDNIGNR
jgi:hypothetical protein